MSWLTDRLDRLQPVDRPWPVDPIAHTLGIPHTDLPNALRMHKATISRYRQLGLTTVQADEWAVRAGLHPADIWPTWTRLDLAGTALLHANRVTCPQGHTYDQRDAAGARRCRQCHRRNARMSAKKRRQQQRSTPAALGPMTPTDYDHYEAAAQ